MIVVYAGSFNPVTKAHEIIAKSVREKLQAKILFVPVSDLYNKPGLAKFNYRYEMLEMVSEDYEDITVSDIENKLASKLGRQPKTYETLHELQKDCDEKIGLLIGTDNFYDLPNWFRFEDLIQEFYMVVYPRKGMDNEFTNSELYQKYHERFVIVDGIEEMDISASMVRDNIIKGNSNHDLLNEKIIAYIDKYRQDIGY